MTSYNKELKTAITLVRNAVQITEWFRKKGFNSYMKDNLSPVTLADFASQAYIISELKSRFSNDEIIAEEENIEYIDIKTEKIIRECLNDLNLGDSNEVKENIKYRGKTSTRQWTVDPIDGTKGYQKGLSYAIGIGFMINSIPKICAIAVPNYNKSPIAIFSAEEGHGTHVSYEKKDLLPVKVSQTENFYNIRLCHSLHHDKPWILKFARKLGIKNYIQMDSMAKFCMIADGTADLYIKPLDKKFSFTWDFMPGALIIKEAGGKITDLVNTELKFMNDTCVWTAPGIVASNGILHEKIINQIKKKNLWNEN